MSQTKPKLYELTPEHRAQLKPWADKWIANAMSTKAMDDADREATRAAILGLYAAANLPSPKHIVFVPSPLVLAIAGPVSAGVWHLRKDPKFAALLFGDAATYAATDDATYAATSAATYAATYAATDDATYAATRDATRAATYAATDDATYAATSAATSAATDDATYAATRDATYAATYAATDDATYAATRDATRAATDAATRAATYAATRDATYAATRDATDAATYAATSAATRDATRWLIGLVGRWWGGWDGGNQCSAWCSYLSFFDRVAGLELPIYEKWRHYEAAALHSGPRYMHPDFCMVSDRPEVLLVDSQNRPHCANGPSHKWRDGWKLHYFHGIRIPAGKEWIIEDPSQITVAQIDAEQNSEVRRVMVEQYGAGRYLADSGAEEVHRDECGILLRKTMNGETQLSVRVLNSTPEPDGTLTRDEALQVFVKPLWWKTRTPKSAKFKEYFLSVHPECRPLGDVSRGEPELGSPQKLTARNAVASTFGMTGAEYSPQVES